MVMLRSRHWAFLFIVAVFASSVRAEEPASDFLKALRDQKYYDTALEYLDYLAESPLAPAGFRDLASYERGILLIQAASLERDMAAKEAKLTAARVSLDSFLQKHPNHPQAAAARRQFGTLLTIWAQIKVAKVKSGGNSELLQEAVGLYDKAFDIFDRTRTEAKNALTKFPKELDPATQQAEIERREGLRDDYLTAWLHSAETWEFKAETAPKDSAKRTEYLNQAAKRYGELFDKHPSRMAGLLARMYQGRVMIELGDDDKALTIFKEDLLGLEEPGQAFRQLKMETTLLAMDCWLDESKKEYAEAITRGNEMLDSMLPGEVSAPKWLALQLDVANASEKFAQELKAKNPKDRQIRASLDAAKELARTVAGVPGEYQSAARELLAKLPGGLRRMPRESAQKVETFDQALKAGRDAISATLNAAFILKNVPQRLEREPDEKEKKNLLALIKEARETTARSRKEAMDSFELALQLADPQTPLDDLNQVRYSLAYLSFSQEYYYEAAVLGEFLARRSPESTWARKGAQIAMAAYWKLYEQAAEENRFETDHIVSIANYIVDTWSGEPEAAEALNTLVTFLIKQGELDKARSYIEGIPENSPERGSAELRIGRAMWRNYVAGMSEIAGWEIAAQAPNADTKSIREKIAQRKPELERVKSMALTILESGVKRMKEAGKVDPSVPLALLTLANIYVDTDQASRAIELLDDQQIGVLPLLARGDPVMKPPRLAEEAHRVALSAFVGALPKASDSAQRSQLIERARQTMKDLKAQVGNSPESQKRLVGIFLKLARGLERQIKLLDSVEDRRLLSKGFESFLDEVRADSTDFGVLNWVAQSYRSLGAGLAGDKEVAALARSFFNKSVDTYDQVLKQAAADSVGAQVVKQLKTSRAIALRQAGKYEQAILAFTALLMQEDRILSIQVEAAKTYQQWAEVRGQAGRYQNAMRGGQNKAGKNVIWGWGRLAKVTQRNKKFRDTFYAARYNLALSKYQLALCQEKAQDRLSNLRAAKRDIERTRSFYPNMSGPNKGDKSWRPKYDALSQQIDRAL